MNGTVVITARRMVASRTYLEMELCLSRSLHRPSRHLSTKTGQLHNYHSLHSGASADPLPLTSTPCPNQREIA